MTPADIEATFPNKNCLPAPIVDIFHYLREHGYPISGCFKLSDRGMDDLKAFFLDDPVYFQQFLPFGRGACGDAYALWLTDGLSPQDAPVVMFGAAGELEVLAINSEQFCRLLCLGYSEIGIDDPTTIPDDFNETHLFRQFMIDRYAFSLPTTATPIIDAAKAAFPLFKPWVEHRVHLGIETSP